MKFTTIFICLFIIVIISNSCSKDKNCSNPATIANIGNWKSVEPSGINFSNTSYNFEFTNNTLKMDELFLGQMLLK